MKSLTAVCQTGAPMPAINPNGRAIARHQHPQRENAEMKMYLSKLKDLVPFMPKNRKLSKLEIIQHVIDYICDLQSELETHPEMSNFDAASALNFVTASQNVAMDDDEDDEELEDAAADDDVNANNEDALTQRLNAEAAYQQQTRHQQQPQQQSSPAVVRQPLVDRQAPNTILPAAATSASVQQQQQQLQSQQQQQFLQQQQQQQQQTVLSAQSSQTAPVEKQSRQISS